ncbi:hypothetical protein M427DRAFT_43768 [Gonapodya prolifera JEL478]|uniref:Uncharacterized protein n=1 Tax=Gonapodya prolifera (strain JEL478) TaxID=1344416 RepID=A0A139AI19_GONPJ|nr:hypothetical protein M427DRAFT_43768 [Gonapodya prolifera JEL478]|eukprot:KXS16339.1 hypothetical protein M427DRAFT_43768 [Gonapodya prolifera JEL478]
MFAVKQSSEPADPLTVAIFRPRTSRPSAPSWSNPTHPHQMPPISKRPPCWDTSQSSPSSLNSAHQTHARACQGSSNGAHSGRRDAFGPVTEDAMEMVPKLFGAGAKVTRDILDTASFNAVDEEGLKVYEMIKRIWDNENSGTD